MQRKQISIIFSLTLVLSLLLGPNLTAAQTTDGGDQPLVQRFQDVPDNYIFASFINALYDNGVIAGFPCGGPGQPCVPPANLPYFAPDQNVTRGQLAKFIDNGRRYIKGSFTGSTGRSGIFTAINDDRSTSSNAGVYAQGATAVWGSSSSTGTSNGYAGYFSNGGGGSGNQFGVWASSPGVGVRGASNAATSSQPSIGVVGQSTFASGYGGVFTGTTGVNSTGMVAYGRTAVEGQASGSGTGDSYAGRFNNEGGNTGTVYGVAAESNSTGGAVGYGGYFNNQGGGNSSQYGIRAAVDSNSSVTSFAGYFNNQAGVDSTGAKIGVYATSAGEAIFGSSSAATNAQRSVGVLGVSSAQGGYGGVFSATNTVSGTGVLANGRTAGVIATTSGAIGGDTYAGYFFNQTGGFGNRYGLYAINRGSVAGDSYGSYVDNNVGGAEYSYGAYIKNKGGFGDQYGLFVQTESGSNGASNFGYGAFIQNIGGGSGDQYGVYAVGGSSTNGDSYGGYFNGTGQGSDTTYGIFAVGDDYAIYTGGTPQQNSVYASGSVSAQSYIDRLGAYSILVQYNGVEPLQAGDVVVLDGNNKLVDGEQHLGVTKGTAQNLDLAVGVAQQRMTRTPHQHTDKDGKPTSLEISWDADKAATSFKAGDMIRIVTHGQVQMQVGGLQFGDRLTIADSGSFSKAVTGGDYIGKLASQPDKNGYATVFVNFK